MMVTWLVISPCITLPIHLVAIYIDIIPCCYQCTWPQLDISPWSYQITWLRTDISPCAYQPSQVPHTVICFIFVQKIFE